MMASFTILILFLILTQKKKEDYSYIDYLKKKEEKKKSKNLIDIGESGGGVTRFGSGSESRSEMELGLQSKPDESRPCNFLPLLSLSLSDNNSS